MKLILSLVMTLTVVTIGACNRSPAETVEDRPPPHVVFISIDTLRADHLGCYGYTRETSPGIDRLAANSVRFNNAFSQSSWTLPSHMSMMTSQYPHVHGVETGKKPLPADGITLAESLSSAGYYTAAFVSWVYVDSRYGFSQGFDKFTELIPPKHKVDSSTKWSFKAEQVSDAAIEWINEPNRGETPFFLFVHYFDPHIDYEPPEGFDRLFDENYTGTAQGTFQWLKTYIKGMHREPNRIDPRDLEYIKSLYDGEIRYTDLHVRRLLDAVDKAVGLDHCLVILTSDHGEEFNDHGSMEGHQWTLYDEIIRVPLIVRFPGAAHAGKVVDAPVELLDIAPTILDFAEVDAPATFQGESLRPLATAEPQTERLVYAETRRHTTRQSIRGSRYKLIHTDDTGTNRRGVPIRAGYELYDLENDPGERNNVYDPEADIARLLVSRLHAIRASGPPTEGDDDEITVELSDEELRLLKSLGYAE